LTRTTNARLAGLLFLLYIATGLTSMALFNRATGGAEGTAATLASLAQHATTVRVTAALTLLMFACAAGLGVTLWALTRDEDQDLAMFALCCRVSEGVIGVVSAVGTLGLVSVATAAAGAAAPDAAAVNALGALLLEDGASMPLGATCFAIGSTLFSWLFLRARSIPVSLAWLGVFASVLLVALLPAQLAGFIRSPVTTFMWLPMLVFEVVLALWLLIKGVAAPPARA
jgi:Domain of unknown function (DUF4386)